MTRNVGICFTDHLSPGQPQVPKHRLSRPCGHAPNAGLTSNLPDGKLINVSPFFFVWSTHPPNRAVADYLEQTFPYISDSSGLDAKFHR